MTQQELMDWRTMYQEIKDQYRLDEGVKVIGHTLHRRLVGHALAVITTVINNGGSDEEVKTAMLYSMVCMDAMKHKLDYKKFAKDYNIKQLAEKYRAKKE